MMRCSVITWLGIKWKNFLPKGQNLSVVATDGLGMNYVLGTEMASRFKHTGLLYMVSHGWFFSKNPVDVLETALSVLGFTLEQFAEVKTCQTKDLESLYLKITRPPINEMISLYLAWACTDVLRKTDNSFLEIDKFFLSHGWNYPEFIVRYAELLDGR